MGNIKGFIKVAPTDSDFQMMKEFIGAPPEVIDTLGPPELFFLEIMKIPRLESRLRAFLYKRQFSTNLERLLEDVENCHNGVKTMKGNKLLGLFLELILYIGNFLNQGTSSGNAFGFRVDILPKLKDTKSPTKPEYSLLHFICNYAEKKKTKLKRLPEQLVPLSKATAEYITSISLESAEMRGGLHSLQKELDVVGKANAESEKKDPFEKVMGKFFVEAADGIKNIVEKCEALMADNKELYTYYCGTKEMCLATIFIEFSRDFEATVKSNQEREARLEKAAEKKKRNKLKNKSTKTSIKKKKMGIGEGDEEEEEEEEEDSGSEEIVEEIIEVSGSGDEEVIEEIIEEVVEEYSESE